MTEIDRTRLAELMERERSLFRERHPASRALFESGRNSLLWGVPMNWMVRWPGDHPVYVAEAEGARFTDVDGNAFVDFCLGDTGGMAGHAPKAAPERPRFSCRCCEIRARPILESRSRRGSSIPASMP